MNCMHCLLLRLFKIIFLYPTFFITTTLYPHLLILPSNFLLFYCYFTCYDGLHITTSITASAHVALVHSKARSRLVLFKTKFQYKSITYGEINNIPYIYIYLWSLKSFFASYLSNCTIFPIFQSSSFRFLCPYAFHRNLSRRHCCSSFRRGPF